MFAAAAKHIVDYGAGPELLQVAILKKRIDIVRVLILNDVDLYELPDEIYSEPEYVPTPCQMTCA